MDSGYRCEKRQAVHIITRKTLLAFSETYPDAASALEHWYRLMKRGKFQNFAELREVFPSADQVEGWVVFNIGGNKYRMIAQYPGQK